MNIWWLAIAVDYANYRDLQLRQVIAQGWRQMGDLSAIARLAREPRHEQVFKSVLRALAEDAYGSDDPILERSGDVLWKLLRARAGDLFVAIEGRTVRGVCELPADGWATYRYQPHTEYAQTIGHPVRWIDWDAAIFGPEPVAPAQGVPGMVQVRGDAERVEEAWTRQRGRFYPAP